MNGEIGRIFDHKMNATKPLPIMQLPGTWELRMNFSGAFGCVLVRDRDISSHCAVASFLQRLSAAQKNANCEQKKH